MKALTLLYYKDPTRSRCAQSILFHCSITLHISGAFHTHHQEYIKCIYSLRYRSYIGAATFRQRDRVKLYMFRVLSTPIIRSTLNCIYSLRYRSYIGAATFRQRGRVKLYMFRVISTPIIRSTLTVSTASGTGHTSVQLPSASVAE